jgi:hypothetical protein
VHRFVVEEAHGGAATTAGAHADQPTEPIHDHAPDGHVPDGHAPDHVPEPSVPEEPVRASRPERDPDADVELPDWARTDAVAAARVTEQPEPAARGGIGSIRDRLRGAADGVRGRAGELRDRVTGADAEREQPAAPAPTAPGTEAQPAFPWSTEEFVAGRDDDDHAPEPPAPATTAPKWDATDQIPEDELPWWRRPKDDR